MITLQQFTSGVVAALSDYDDGNDVYYNVEQVGSDDNSVINRVTVFPAQGGPHQTFSIITINAEEDERGPKRG